MVAAVGVVVEVTVAVGVDTAVDLAGGMVVASVAVTAASVGLAAMQAE